MPLVKEQVQVHERQETGRQTPALRLNHFQQMMLEWDKIHPYNAVHAVSVAGRSDVPALRGAVHRACAAAGIGELTVDCEHRTYRYEPVEDIPMHHLPASCDAWQTLCAVISEEMNTPFSAEPHLPLRWTVFDDTVNDDHLVILAYHHVAADAYSIQALLSLVLHYYLDLSLPGKDPVLHTPVSSHGNLFSQGTHRSNHVRSFVRAVHQYFKLRYAHRMHDDRSGRSETKFILQSAPDGTLDRLRDVCRAEEVGINDAFLAALVTTLAQLTPARQTHRRRRKIAVATVLSCRERAGEELPKHFGVYLSDAALLIDKPDAGMRGVLAQIVPQTRRLKALQGAIEPSWRFLFAKYLWPALRIPHSEASYRKVFPLCAGVSTVPVDATLFGEAMGRIRYYVRACPPGPAMPMLLAPTMAAGRLELGLVFRPAYLNEGQARGLLDLLVDVLGEFIR